MLRRYEPESPRSAGTPSCSRAEWGWPVGPVLLFSASQAPAWLATSGVVGAFALCAAAYVRGYAPWLRDLAGEAAGYRVMAVSVAALLLGGAGGDDRHRLFSLVLALLIMLSQLALRGFGRATKINSEHDHDQEYRTA